MAASNVSRRGIAVRDRLIILVLYSLLMSVTDLRSADLLDTLDTGWGKWKYSPEKRTPIFSDNALVAKYNAYFKSMQVAHTDQKQTLAQLANLPPTRFTDVVQTAQR